MDLGQLNQQFNDALNRWITSAKKYFSGLSQMEWYGWGAFGLGFVLFVTGTVLLL